MPLEQLLFQPGRFLLGLHLFLNFGDGGLVFTGEFDGPDKIKGTMRPSMISRTFPFWMVRRP